MNIANLTRLETEISLSDDKSFWSIDQVETFCWRDIGGQEACRPASGLLTGENAFPIHRHDFPEVFWVTQGRGTHEINGQNKPLLPGILVLIRPEDAHGFNSDSQGVLVQNIAIRAGLLAEVKRRHFLRDDFFWNGDSPIPLHHELNHDQLKRLQGFFDELCFGPWDEFSAERFLLNLLHVLRARPRVASNASPHEDLPDWLAQALMRWRAESKHLVGGTPALARLAGRSPEHVARTLRECTGRTPTDWLNESRMARAAQLLAITNRKILDIAMDCGFGSLGHFYSVFQSAHGCAPRTYRMRFLPRPI